MTSCKEKLAEATRQLQRDKEDALAAQSQLLTAKFEQELAQLKRILQDEANQASEVQSRAEQRIQELIIALEETNTQHQSQVRVTRHLESICDAVATFTFG